MPRARTLLIVLAMLGVFATVTLCTQSDHRAPVAAVQAAAVRTPAWPAGLLPDLALGPPLAPARMNRKQVVQAAEAYGGPRIFRQGIIVMFRYGSLNPDLIPSTTVSYCPEGLAMRRCYAGRLEGDYWEITLTGVAVPVSGAQNALPPPDAHTMIVVVDDAAGKAVEAALF